MIVLFLSAHTAAGEGQGGMLEERNAPHTLQPQGFSAVWMDAGRSEVERIAVDRARVLSRYDPEAVFGKESDSLAPPVRLQWANICKEFASLSPEKQLRYINGFFNGWTSKRDASNYEKDDYWAAPDEFLATGGGDCEDYAIIKYLALRYLGWPAERLWIVTATNMDTGSKHALLVADTGSRCFVLDNLSRPTYLLIPATDYFKMYSPIFAVNEDDIWVYRREDGTTSIAGRAEP